MSIIDETSTRSGQRGGTANKAVARKCLENPTLLKEIAAGLACKDVKTVADCCEVFTETAKVDPSLIVPHIEELLPLQAHKNGRVQWESMHALALAAHLVPEVIRPFIPILKEKIAHHASVIVRDDAILALKNYASVGNKEANEVYPILASTLPLWDAKHAKLILEAFVTILRVAPELQRDILQHAETYVSDTKSSVAKAALKVKKLCTK